MTKAPYIVYTPDKDFVLEKDDISGGGGSGGGVFLIESETTQSGVALKKTWKEIEDAFISGESCIIILSPSENMSNRFLITTVVNNNSQNLYMVAVITPNGVSSFATDSENGYPTMSMNNG